MASLSYTRPEMNGAIPGLTSPTMLTQDLVIKLSGKNFL